MKYVLAMLLNPFRNNIYIKNMKRKVSIATKCNIACSGNQPQPQGTKLSNCTDYALSPSRPT
jgi:hypothetical protein